MTIVSSLGVNVVTDFVDYINHEKIHDSNFRDRLLDGYYKVLQHGVVYDDYSKVIIPVAKKIIAHEVNKGHYIFNDRQGISIVESNDLTKVRTNELLKVSFVNLGTFILKESDYIQVMTMHNKTMLQQIGFCKVGDSIKTYLAFDQIKSIEKYNGPDIVFCSIKTSPICGLHICNSEDSFDYLFVTDLNNQ